MNRTVPFYLRGKMWCNVCQREVEYNEHFMSIEHRQKLDARKSYALNSGCDEDCKSCVKSKLCKFGNNGEA